MLTKTNHTSLTHCQHVSVHQSQIDNLVLTWTDECESHIHLPLSPCKHPQHQHPLPSIYTRPHQLHFKHISLLTEAYSKWGALWVVDVVCRPSCYWLVCALRDGARHTITSSCHFSHWRIRGWFMCFVASNPHQTKCIYKRSPSSVCPVMPFPVGCVLRDYCCT